VSLAGLLLIFSGFLFTQATSFPQATTDDATINRYRNAARFALVPMVLCFGLAALGIRWLLTPSPGLFTVVWGAFLLLLIVTALYGAYVLLCYL
jgi:hypothetical protein